MALTDDLILEILVRLPVKSLVRFQCVRKPWRTSISSSNFVTRHCSRENQGSSLRILYSANPPQCVDHETLLSHNKGDGPVPVTVLPLDHVPGNRAIVGSCNGLICLLGLPGRFFLWNPSTRQIKALPILTSFRNVSERGHMFYGFGYDSKGGDYKVVCGIKPVLLSGNPTTTIAVFSLKRGSWGTRVRFQDADFPHLFGPGCLSNGALHWLQYLKDERKQHLLSSKARVIAFDLHEEEFQGIVKLSDLINAEWVTSAHVVIGTCTDSIYLVYESLSYALTVSKMKEYKVQQSWPLEIKGGDRNCFVPRVMCMLEKGGVLMRFLMTFRNTDLALYDPEEKACMTDLVTSDRFYPNASVMFTETLVSPITGHGVDI